MRKDADVAKNAAKYQAALAERAAHGETEQRRRATEGLDRQLTEQANDLLQSGDPLGAVHPLIDALHEEAGDPYRQRLTRIRLGVALGSGFGLRRQWMAKSVLGDATFSPDGDRVAVADRSGLTRIYDVESGAPLGSPMRSPSAVIQVVFSSDGRRLATLAKDGSVGLWNAASGEAIHGPAKYDDRNPVIAFSPDGDLLAEASGDEDSPTASLRLLDGHTGAAKRFVPLQSPLVPSIRAPGGGIEGFRVLGFICSRASATELFFPP